MQGSNRSKNSLEKKWLITGGRGFVGTNLRIALNEQAPRSKITVVDDCTYDAGYNLDYETSCYFGFDVTDYEAMYDIFTKVKPDYVIHLAANTEVRKSIDRPMACFSDNIEGTLNCLNLSNEFRVKRVIVASSCGVVGNSCIIADEGTHFDAISPYASSKICAEEISKAYMKLGLGVTVLRFSNIFGPWSHHKNSVVAKFMRAYLKKQFITIYGTGKQTRNFLYVKDAVQSILKTIECGISGVFCIASLKSYSIDELIEILDEVFGYTIKRRKAKEISGEIHEIEINTSKARSNLHFRCEYSFLDGIKETCDWYKKI